MGLSEFPKLHSGKAAAALLCTILAFAVASCGRKEAPEPPPAETSSANRTPIDAASAGSIKGTITLQGTAPKMRDIHMNAVPNCAKQHSSPPMTEDVVLGDNNALQNVVVYLKGDFSQYSFDAPTDPAKIDQLGCVYVPHVVAVRAGAPLQFLSSDDTTHNIHPVPGNNREWNTTQTPRGEPINESFAREEVAIPVKCNLHPWMRAYVAVISHPYFQVTGKDGAFELNNVPPGTYALTTWHEYYGTKTQQITVNPKQEQTVAITLSR